jgi:hypothetical protein
MKSVAAGDAVTSALSPKSRRRLSPSEFARITKVTRSEGTFTINDDDSVRWP